MKRIVLPPPPDIVRRLLAIVCMLIALAFGTLGNWIAPEPKSRN